MGYTRVISEQVLGVLSHCLAIYMKRKGTIIREAHEM